MSIPHDRKLSEPTVGVDGGDPSAASKSTRRDRNARAGILSGTSNYGIFLKRGSSTAWADSSFRIDDTSWRKTSTFKGNYSLFKITCLPLNCASTEPRHSTYDNA
ncbi:hypothetical protein Y032_0081g1469 [Ancylostoma ceylanicum]|uniref:Uncharacterized protein n=1 Tax=Ancylostoma ceylanicum TaxID=53326 RepID=A0A016TS91_9BILA|nr:hypothetical protein Y032_0081g1469 [Ancylostoma ceylanicum]